MPQVVLRLKDAYGAWLTIHRDFPKVERYGLGQRLDQCLLDVLEQTFTAAFLPPEHKVPLLGRAIARLDMAKFFAQLAWEQKLVATTRYALLLAKLEEAGRMLGGWRKGLQSKTPAPPK